MPDERDDEPGPEGPHRPSHPRRPTYRTEAPGVGGNTTHDQKAQPRAPSDDAPLESRPDPRFHKVPMTSAEQKALFDAPTPEEANKELGRMQEDRVNDGRLPQPVPDANKPAPFIDRSMSAEEQATKGIKPTAEDLAYIQAATNEAEAQTRAEEFLRVRAAHNKELFNRSRKWGAEIHRQTHPGAPSPDTERERGPHGAQAWRSEIAELHKAAYRASREVASPFTRHSSSPDPRFANAPITRAEMESLRQAATPEAANQLLGQMHESRLKDSPSPPTTSLHPEKALINQALPLQEQIQLSLRPTAQEFSYMQAGAIRGQEFNRTMEFIAERHAQNDRIFDETRENATQQKAHDWWQQRRENSMPSTEREARTEKAERRTDLQQLRAAMRERREQAAENEGNQGRQGREQGGRER